MAKSKAPARLRKRTQSLSDPLAPWRAMGLVTPGLRCEWEGFPSLAPSAKELARFLDHVRKFECFLHEYRETGQWGDRVLDEAKAVRDAIAALPKFAGWCSPEFMVTATDCVSQSAAAASKLHKPGQQPIDPAPLHLAMEIFAHRLDWATQLRLMAEKVQFIEDRTGTRLRRWQHAQWFIDTWESYGQGQGVAGVGFAEFCEARGSRRVSELNARRADETTRDCSHSDDFRSVQWFGTPYSFTQNQAILVQKLWANWEQGTPDISGVTLTDPDVINQSRVDLVFRANDAWGTMLGPGNTRGSYRLYDPPRTVMTRTRVAKKSRGAAKKHM